MKIILTILIALLIIPQSIQAQEGQPETGQEDSEDEGEGIELYPEIPQGEIMLDPDGNPVVVYTAEQNQQIMKAYYDFYLLSDFAIMAIFEIGRLNVLVEEQAETIANLDDRNKGLVMTLDQSIEQNKTLSSELAKKNRKRVGLVVGLNILTCIGAGFLGYGIGHSVP